MELIMSSSLPLNDSSNLYLTTVGSYESSHSNSLTTSSSSLSSPNSASSLTSSTPTPTNSGLARQVALNLLGSEKPEFTLADLARSSFKQPVKKLQDAKFIGWGIAVMVRPMNLANSAVREVMKYSWDKASHSKYGPTIGKTAYKAAAGVLNVLYVAANLPIATITRQSVPMFPYSGEDLARPAKLSSDPQTLVAFRESVERANRTFYISKIIVPPMNLLIGTINIIYRTNHTQNANLIDIPEVPEEISNLVLGNGDEAYRPFAVRFDDMLVDVMGLNNFQELPPERTFAEVRNQVSVENIATHLKNVVASDAARISHNLAVRVFRMTRQQRIKLFEALDGMVMALICDAINKRAPRKEEFAKWAITKFGPGIITGALASSGLLPEIMTQGRIGGIGSFVLENSPAGCLLLMHELDRMRANGNNHLNSLSNSEGWTNLFLGRNRIVEDGVMTTNPALDSDPNQSSLIPLISEFTLGTFVRMCNDERLGGQKGILGLIQLALRETLTREATPAEGIQITIEIPGLNEVKEALYELIYALRDNLYTELTLEGIAEKERQATSASNALTNGAANHAQIARERAVMYANGFNRIGVPIKADTIYKVTYEAPSAVLHSAMNGASSLSIGLVNRASSAVGALRRRPIPAQNPVQKETNQFDGENKENEK